MSYPPVRPLPPRPYEYPAGTPRVPEPESEPEPRSARTLVLVLALLVVAGTAIYLWLPKLEMPQGLSLSGETILDVAQLPMPFDPPRVSAPERLPGAADLAPAAQEVLALRRAFFAGDFVLLEQGLAALRESSRAPERASVRFSPFLGSLDDTVMAGLDRCEQWLRVMPESYLAHWTCAKIWNSGAWDARTGASYSRLSPAQIALMKERMAASNRLLEQALLLDPAPFEALSQLGHNHLVLGTGLGHHYLDQAERVEPRYVSVHRQRTSFSRPQWGGSMEAVAASIERARSAGLAEEDLLNFTETFLTPPGKMATPGAGRDYWYQVLEQKVTQDRLRGLLQELGSVKNHQAIVPVAEQMIELYPEEALGYQWLAFALRHLGHTERALQATFTAAALGNDRSLEELILAHIRGGLGIEGGDMQSLVELCKYAAALGSKVGGNCMGAGSFEGISPDVPFEYDPAQGYAWHLLGARAGHYNSQFDLGWMLYTGRVPGISPEDGHTYGIFWLRRAAEAGHRFAGARLDELGIARSEWVLGNQHGGLDQLLLQFRILLSSFGARLDALRTH